LTGVADFGPAPDARPCCDVRVFSASMYTALKP
jgi:hypothetical protein